MIYLRSQCWSQTYGCVGCWDTEACEMEHSASGNPHLVNLANTGLKNIFLPPNETGKNPMEAADMDQYCQRGIAYNNDSGNMRETGLNIISYSQCTLLSMLVRNPLHAQGEKSHNTSAPDSSS